MINRPIPDSVLSKRWVQNTSGQVWKPACIIFALLFGSMVGGLLNRVRGGLIPLPDIHTDIFFLDVFVYSLTSSLLTFALPLGILVGILCKESGRVDPYYCRRAILGLAACSLTFFTLYVRMDGYYNLGRNNDSWKAPVGIFDWLLGHGCPEWGFGRRWLREFVGISLLGWIHTAPAGLLFFFLGYGFDYFFSGIAMGVIYEIAWLIPSNIKGLENGTNLGQFLFGSWIWLVLMVTILSYRNNPNNTLSIKGKKFRVAFYAILLALECILIGSSVVFHFVQKKSALSQDQTFLGLIGTCLGLLMVHIACLIAKPQGTNAKQKNTFVHYFDESKYNLKTIDQMMKDAGVHYLPINCDDERVPLNINTQESMKLVIVARPSDLMIPRGRKPYNYFLFVIRWLCALILMVIVPLTIYLTFYRFAHCSAPALL